MTTTAPDYTAMSNVVERLVDLGVRLAGDLDDDPAQAADVALTDAPAEAVTDLARLGLAGLIRTRMRADTLTVERAAEQRTRGRRPRRGSRAHRAWLQTDEGRAHEDAREECERRHQTALTAKLTSILDDYRARLRIEWTAELLACSIALPDGTRTTWGQATIEQHRARADMFRSQMVAGAEGAARHLKAIDDLRAGGAPCLAELVGAVA